MGITTLFLSFSGVNSGMISDVITISLLKSLLSSSLLHLVVAHIPYVYISC